MIINIYGSQGGGKSLYLVKKGFEAYQKGFEVYTNFKVNFPHKILKFVDLKECTLNNAVVFIDEAHLWGLDARSSNSKNNKLLVKKFISQVRKQGVTLYTATQYPRQLDVRVRENSDYIIYCKKYVWDGEEKKILDVVQSEHFKKNVDIIIEVNIIRKYDSKEGIIYFMANPLYDLYDTREVIEMIEDG